MKRQDPWIDTNLDDLDGEIWDDIFGYDGIYEVSNLGRVKSLGRLLVRTMTKERILKQFVYGNIAPSIKLSVNGAKETKNVCTLVADAFLRARQPGECVIHQNKRAYDNRLSNLKIGTYSESGLLDYKLGLKEDWGISSLSKQRTAKHEKEFCVFENGELKAMICHRCMTEKPISEYNRNGSKIRQLCKSCVLVSMGVKSVGKSAEALSLANNGYRKCWRCNETKELETQFYKSAKSFLGRSNTCKGCQSILNAENKLKRHERRMGKN